MTPEGRVEHEIFNFLRELGVLAFKHDSVGIFDPVKKVYRKSRNTNRVAGVADIIGIINLRPFAIEVKSATGKLTKEQRLFLVWFQNHGGIAFVARSAKDVRAEFAKHFPDDEDLQRLNQ